ncbi:hypothetical protein D3C85_66830 [compost metagenome]
MEYGNTADSRIESQGKSTILTWNLNRVSSTNGNFFSLNYLDDNAVGESYLQRIDYTGNANNNTSPSNSVLFVYEARNDFSYVYLAGSINGMSKRLSNIHVYKEQEKNRNYKLTYEYGVASSRSRLSNITECLGDEEKCLLPITINWQDVETGGFNGDVEWWGSDSTGVSKVVGTVDMNGDGKADLIVQYDQAGIRKWEVRLSNGNSFGSGAIWSSTTVADVTVAGIADVNGDGLPDLVLQNDVGGTRYWQARLSNNESFVDSGIPWASIGATTADVLGLADLNGDGKADLVIQYDQGAWRYWAGYLSTGSSFDNSTGWWSTASPIVPAWLADVDGDGKTDLVIQYYTSANNWLNVQARLSTGTAFLQGDWWWQSGFGSTMTGVGLSDVNADGLADFVIQYDQGSTRFWKALISTGKTFKDINSSGEFWAQITPGNGSIAGLSDVNGDGRADLTIQYDQADTRYWKGHVSKSTSFSSDNHWWSQISPSTGTVVGMADVNGDGKVDLIIQYDHGGVRYWQARVSKGGLPDIVTSVTAGVAKFTLSVLPLTKEGVYIKDVGVKASVFPLLDLQLPSYVVSSVSASNGAGGTVTTNYKYGGLKAELGTGRGMLGFRWLEATQAETGIVTRTEFKQDWPYTGLVSKTQKSLAGAGNNGVLSQVDNTYGCTDFVSSTGCTTGVGKRYYVYASQSTESSWDVNGAALPTIITASQYDIWGNATQVSVSSSDGYSKVTTNSFSNDVGNWYLGRLNKASVTSISP